MRRAATIATYTLTSLVGVIAFLYPFWLPQVAQDASGDLAHAGDSALMVTVLVGICFVVLLLEVQREAVGAKSIALLGVLVAINATLRFAEVAVPGPGGFSPIFPLIIFGGYVFGGGFGFLLGALTLLVSALVTGGVGPWLPYQMFTAGWVGMSAGWLPGRGLNWPRWKTLALLAGFGVMWGFAYGAILNLSFWYVLAGDPATAWVPGLDAGAIIARYGGFYAVTSFVPDLFRALGNAALLVVFGPPTLKALRRARRQLAFERETE
jgi:energy-coupling factor transport system substrate-specific component